MEPGEALVYKGLESLKEGKIVCVAPQGISMLPFINGEGDMVLLMKKDTVEVGDIVLVEYHGKHILHRVYAIEEERITLMGDGNLEGTEQVATDEVIGTVVEIVHDGRHRKPRKAWLWRKLLPVRGLLLKLNRKWNKLKKK